MVSDSSLGGTCVASVTMTTRGSQRDCRQAAGHPVGSPPTSGALLDQLPGMLGQLQGSCLYGGVRTQEENLDGAFLDNYLIALVGLCALKLTAM